MDIETIVIIILFGVVVALLVYILHLNKQKTKLVGDFENEKDVVRKDALNRSRPIIKGLVAEQIVPFLEDFRYKPADARFIGAPIDYVIFDGYSDKSEEITVVLADIKTGKSANLTSGQRKIRDAVNEKRVKWETIHINLKETGEEDIVGKKEKLVDGTEIVRELYEKDRNQS